MIPLLSAAWLLTVKPAHAQYPSGGNTSNTGFMNNGQPPINNNTGNNSGSTGYPGGSTGYPGSTDGSNTGYTGIVGGTNSGYPGNNNGTGTGYPGSTGGGTGTGYPGSTGGNNTGYPGGGTNGTGYPGSTGGSNTGYPGSTGGSNSGSNTGYPGGGTGGTGTGYPGGGTNSGNTGGTGTGYPGGGTGTGTGTGGGTITPGHWDVSYSSKSATTSWDYVGYDANYKSTAKPDSRQWPATASGDGVYGDSYLDADTTGTVTATLTWVPTTGQDATSDPPSSSVIVTEYGSASASGGGPGTGSADDGWGDTSGGGGYPGSSSGGGGYPGSASSSGTHYEVKDGSSGSITLTKTLSASTPKNTTPDASGNFAAVGAMVSVGLSIVGASATISLPGTSTDTDGSKKALTGQGVTAQFSGLPSGYTVSSYTWSFTGGTPIKNWDPSWPKFPATTNPTQTVPLTDADTKGTDTSGNGIPVADLSFYYTKKGSLTVTCTVNYTSPDGKTGSMTVQSQPIAYVKPTVKWPVGNSFNGAQPGFSSNQPQGSFSAQEIWGPVAITEPAPFAGKGYGTGCFVQIATINRSWTRVATNNPPTSTYSKIQTMSADGTTKMVAAPTGLDVDFPYPYGYSPNGDPSNPDPTNWTLSLSLYTWPTSAKGYAIDEPFQPYTIADQDNGGTDWRTSTATDHFTTWVMYEPPSKDGQGTIYVPLQKLTWKWGGTATRNTSTNLWAVQQSPQFDPGTPGDADDYPTWTLSIPFRPPVGP